MNSSAQNHSGIATLLMRFASVLLLVFSSACGTTPAPSAESNPAVIAVQSSSTPKAPITLSGDFEGTYTCEQGETGVFLTLEVAEDNTAKALFDFFPLDTNPNVPRGSFRMRGIVDGKNIKLDADESDWISQPDGWVTIDLDGRFDDSLNEIAGDVKLLECTVFQVTRQQ